MNEINKNDFRYKGPCSFCLQPLFAAAQNTWPLNSNLTPAIKKNAPEPGYQWCPPHHHIALISIFMHICTALKGGGGGGGGYPD